jgi:hypothetical protein
LQQQDSDEDEKGDEEMECLDAVTIERLNLEATSTAEGNGRQ